METYRRGTYPLKLDRLPVLHASMRKIGTFVHIFNFSYNDIMCKVIFQTNTDPYSLTFVKIPCGQVLPISIVRGYRALIDPATQQRIREFFEINSQSGGFFSFKDFVASVNNKVPTNAEAKKSATDRRIIARVNGVEEADKIYVLSFKNWDEINRRAGKKVGSRSDENLKKTKLLYPDLFHEIESNDISVCYTDDPEKSKYHFQNSK